MSARMTTPALSGRGALRSGGFRLLLLFPAGKRDGKKGMAKTLALALSHVEFRTQDPGVTAYGVARTIPQYKHLALWSIVVPCQHLEPAGVQQNGSFLLTTN